MSDQRILRYQVVLMEIPALTIYPLARFLTQLLPCLPPRTLSPFTLAQKLWTNLRKGCSEDPLTNPEKISYTDGSSFVLNGNRRVGYAVFSNFETIEAKHLPPGTSAQLAESLPWFEVLELGKGKSRHLHCLQICLSGTICTCYYSERKRSLDH